MSHCAKHPLSSGVPMICVACRGEKLDAFESQLTEAILDIVPTGMRLMLKNKIVRVVKIIAMVMR